MTTTSPAYVNDISASSYTTREEDEEDDDDDDERCQKDFKGIVITRSECFQQGLFNLFSVMNIRDDIPMYVLCMYVLANYINNNYL